MKYKYDFCNEAVEIDVPEEWVRVLQDLDREEYNSDHKERRRSISLEVFDPDEIEMATNKDVEEMILANIDANLVRKCIQRLPNRERYLIDQIYFLNRSYSEVAREEGVNESSIRRAAERAFRHLKNILLKK